MKWSSLTYSQKNKYLLYASIIFLLVVYRLALSITLDLYLENSYLEDKVSSYHATLSKQEELVHRRAVLEDRIKAYFVDSLAHQDILIETVSEFAHQNHVLINEFPAMTSFIEGDFEVGTYKMVLEGSYKNLLKLVYLLEQENKIGKVSSSKFQFKFDTKRKRNILTLTLYVQNIQTIENNESDED